jgi:hypothetical protein
MRVRAPWYAYHPRQMRVCALVGDSACASVGSVGGAGCGAWGVKRGSVGERFSVGVNDQLQSGWVRDEPKVPRINGRGKWTFSVDWVATALVAAVCVLAVALLALLRQNTSEAKWPWTLGTIQDTRIVADHALQTKWGGQLTWKAEYSVAYSVASREYTVWADSGIRGESEDGVRLALPRSRPSCQVRYKPETPGVSVADCR